MNTGVGCHALFQGLFLTQDQTQVSRIAGRFFTVLATGETQEYWKGEPTPSPGDLPDPGIEPGFLHCRKILCQLSHKGSPGVSIFPSKSTDFKLSVSNVVYFSLFVDEKINTQTEGG